MKTNIFVTTLLCCATMVSVGHAEEIGSVDTEFKMFGPDHKIVVEAFDDPKIEGITCYLSRSKKGGWRTKIVLEKRQREICLRVAAGFDQLGERGSELGRACRKRSVE